MKGSSLEFDGGQKKKEANGRDEGNGYNSVCAGNDPRRPAKDETILLKP